jgi:hypothetical protein
MECNPNARTVFFRGGCLEVGFSHGFSGGLFEKTNRLFGLFVSTARN